jgi:hypothetical protein
MKIKTIKHSGHHPWTRNSYSKELYKRIFDSYPSGIIKGKELMKQVFI